VDDVLRRDAIDNLTNMKASSRVDRALPRDFERLKMTMV
jgi:hypothetical protein